MNGFAQGRPVGSNTPRQIPEWLERIPRLSRAGWGQPIVGAPEPLGEARAWSALARSRRGQVIDRPTLLASRRRLPPAERWLPAKQMKTWVPPSRQRILLLRVSAGLKVIGDQVISRWMVGRHPPRQVPRSRRVGPPIATGPVRGRRGNGG